MTHKYKISSDEYKIFVNIQNYANYWNDSNYSSKIGCIRRVDKSEADGQGWWKASIYHGENPLLRKRVSA